MGRKWSQAHILELLDATTKKNGPQNAQNPSDDFLSYGISNYVLPWK